MTEQGDTRMTPRDGVLTALEHREPDRVAIEFGSPATLSIIDGEPYGYAALCAELGIAALTARRCSSPPMP